MRINDGCAKICMSSRPIVLECLSNVGKRKLDKPNISLQTGVTLGDVVGFAASILRYMTNRGTERKGEPNATNLFKGSLQANVAPYQVGEAFIQLG